MGIRSWRKISSRPRCFDLGSFAVGMVEACLFRSEGFRVEGLGIRVGGLGLSQKAANKAQIA